MEHELLDNVTILFALAVVGVVLFRRISLPPVLGYLCVGAIVGPHAFGWLPNNESVRLLGEVGLAFLLFTIGLEFSIPRFLSMRRTILGLGGAQVAFSTLAGCLVARHTGLSWEGALIAGGAMSLSSTAVVVRQMTEQLELNSRHGRNALGVLLFQDVAAVPFLIAIPILAGDGGQSLAIPLLVALAKGAAVFFLMFAIGHWALRPLFDNVAAARSTELFTLTVLLVAISAAWLTEWFGLSLALGAFLAGIMLGETEYRHQIETDIRPFRDVLMGLFFISIGALLDVFVLLKSWYWIVLLVFGLVIGKGLLTILLTRAAGYELGVAFRTGVVLAQGGEFGFALLAVAVLNGVLNPDDVQAIMAALVVSMGLAPIIIRYNGALTKKIFAGTYTANRRKLARDLETAAYVLNDHVIICGFGRIGQNLANFLYSQGFTYAALDLDPWLIKEASAAGETVFYGDATHTEILKSLGLARARAVVITCSEVHTAEKIIYAVRGLNKEIAVIARTVDDSHLEALEQAGATEIIPEAVEASMMLATYLLQRLNVPVDEVMCLVENARADHYRHLRSFFHGSEMESIEEVDQYRLHTVVLPPNSYAVGRSIGSLLLEEHNVRVYAVKRGAIRGEAPDDTMVFKAGDTVVLQGAAESIEYAENKLLVG